jgi:hypothetical protein
LIPPRKTAAILPPLVSIIIRSMGRSHPAAGDGFNRRAKLSMPGNGSSSTPRVKTIHHCLNTMGGFQCGSATQIGRCRAVALLIWAWNSAQGDYLLFLDDDDWLLPNHINALMTALQQQLHLRIAYAGVEASGKWRGAAKPRWSTTAPLTRFACYTKNYLPIHAVLFERRLFLKAVGLMKPWMFTKIGISGCNCALPGPFVHVDQVSAIYRISPTENPDSADRQKLLLAAWNAIIHKWRDRWSDSELWAICARAKDGKPGECVGTGKTGDPGSKPGFNGHSEAGKADSSS